MTIAGESKVQLRDRRGICSKDDWCWQNPLPQENWLNGVWGSDANNFWAVGGSGTIVHWNGSTWSTQPSGTSHGLNGVWGSAANGLWTVSGGGTIAHGDGSAWARQIIGTAGGLNGVWGIDANSIWAVGSGGTILRYRP